MRMPSHVCAPREYSSAGHSRGQAMSSSLNMSLEGQETQDTSHGCESEGSSESSSSVADLAPAEPVGPAQVQF